MKVFCKQCGKKVSKHKSDEFCSDRCKYFETENEMYLREKAQREEVIKRINEAFLKTR